MLFGRLFSARDDQQAQRGAYLSVIGIALSAVVIVCIGLDARGLAPEGTSPDSILTQIIPSIMPAWASIALLFALLSTIISSADSCLITAATVLEHDILGGKNVGRCRVLMLGIGLGALAIAMSGGDILTLLLAANDIYVCGVVAPMTVAILAHDKRNISIPFMLLAIILGGICGIMAAYTGAKVYSYAGVGISLIMSLAAVVQPRVSTES